MARFGIQQIRLNNTLYPGVKGSQFDRGLEVNSDGSDGTVYETTHHVPRRKPAAEIGTLSLKTLITALNGSTDFPMLALDGTNGLEMFGARQAANAVGYQAGSVHSLRKGARGVLWLGGVRWSLGSPAEAILRAMFISADGTTEAISEIAIAALPTAPTPDFGFTLSALTVAGTSIPTVNAFEISIDPRFDWDHAAGLPEPTSIVGAGANGKLAITAKVDTGDIDLGSGTGATSAVFRRYAIGGGFGTDTVTFTFNSVFSHEEQVGGQNGQPMSRALMIRTRHDGTNRPLTWATA
ncbi:MAG TPA: hypothetical protein VEL07_19840 [Planctomycetota bacterium]|nr:hypothetical protein [Planctomycetota bacterium]